MVESAAGKLLDSAHLVAAPYVTGGNLHSSSIVRHMLTKWTDHPPGIADEASTVVGVNGSGIGKYVS